MTLHFMNHCYWTASDSVRHKNSLFICCKASLMEYRIDRHYSRGPTGVALSIVLRSGVKYLSGRSKRKRLCTDSRTFELEVPARWVGENQTSRLRHVARFAHCNPDRTVQSDDIGIVRYCAHGERQARRRELAVSEAADPATIASFTSQKSDYVAHRSKILDALALISFP